MHHVSRFTSSFRIALILGAATLLLTTTAACGQFRSLGLDFDSDDQPTEPAAPTPDDVDAGEAAKDGGPTAEDIDGSHTYVDGGPITTMIRRCATSLPFVQSTTIKQGTGAPPLSELNSFVLSSLGSGVVSFRDQDQDDDVLKSIRLVGDSIQSIPTFAPVGELDALQSAMDDETSASVNTDGSVIVLHRQGSSGSRSLVSSRAKVSDPFGLPLLITHSLGTGSIIDPYLVDTTLYFAFLKSDASTDLYVADLDVSTGRTSNAKKITGTATNNDEQAPTVSGDQLEIFYAVREASSQQTFGGGGGGGGGGGNNNNNNNNNNSSPTLKIFHTTRKSTSEEFGPGKQLDTTQMGSNDTPLPAWLSFDGCDLYTLGNQNGTFSLRRLRRQAPP